MTATTPLALAQSNRRPAFTGSLIIGTALQLAMVLAGHWIELIKLNVFAVGGMAISLLAGVIYARRARTGRGQSALYGALVGGACALIGIIVSFALGDVTASILLLGTLSSAVTGAIGGAIAGGAR
ncbi:MAG TPA: hypothetical protein VGD02_11605 [Gemmatimonadaceae bacterium]|jgi:hypothetical protein